MTVEGRYDFKLTEEQLTTLKEKLNKEDFNSFKTKYDNPKLMDLPSTYIQHNGKQVEIRIWKDAPAALIDMHEYIQDLLLEQKLFE